MLNTNPAHNRSTTVPRKRKYIFYGLLICLVVFSVEIFGNVLFYLIKGSPHWKIATSTAEEKKNIFNIRSVCEFVSDGRMHTLKEGYHKTRITSLKTGALIDGDSTIWNFVDENKFLAGNNRYFKDKNNIIFLGDSVPFGWILPGTKTYPSLFYEQVEKKYPGKYGVINAAVPGYHLYNAVERFKIEIQNKFPVNLVIVQTTEPLITIINNGENYKKEMCWADPDLDNLSVIYNKVEKYRKHNLYKFSIIYSMAVDSYTYYNKMKYQHKEKEIKEKLAFDKNSLSTVAYEIYAPLNELHQLLREKNIPLIILPANIPKHMDIRSKDSPVVFVAGYVAQIYENFASMYPDVFFLDVRKGFRNSGLAADELFLDDCCHLTEFGSSLQASWLFRELDGLGLLQHLQ